jgi:hypothetical protein
MAAADRVGAIARSIIAIVRALPDRLCTPLRLKFHWLNGHTAKKDGNPYAAVNAIYDIDCQLRHDVDEGMITSQNS